MLARARVKDDDPVSVVTNDAGDVIGFNVAVLINSGEFSQKETIAILTSEVGSEIPDMPMPGTSLIVGFLDGVIDGGCYVLRQIPGGDSRPIPKATAGVAVDDDGLGANQVRMPPKGCAIRFYMRGAPMLIRLKGSQDGYCGEFYLEADDQAASSDGKNGTFMRIVLDPTTKKMCWKARDATGASFTLLDGIATIESPDHSHQIRVGDDGIFIAGDNIQITGNKFIRIDGLTMVNMLPGAPPVPGVFSVLYGPGGPTGAPSTSFFVGMLWLSSISPSIPHAGRCRSSTTCPSTFRPVSISTSSRCRCLRRSGSRCRIAACSTTSRAQRPNLRKTLSRSDG